MDRNTVIEVLSRFDNDYVLTDEEIDAVGEAVWDLEAIRDKDYIPRYEVIAMLWNILQTIEGKAWKNNNDGVMELDFSDADQVIREHISELKGGSDGTANSSN